MAGRILDTHFTSCPIVFEPKLTNGASANSVSKPIKLTKDDRSVST